MFQTRVLKSLVQLIAKLVVFNGQSLQLLLLHLLKLFLSVLKKLLNGDFGNLWLYLLRFRVFYIGSYALAIEFVSLANK